MEIVHYFIYLRSDIDANGACRHDNAYHKGRMAMAETAVNRQSSKDDCQSTNTPPPETGRQPPLKTLTITLIPGITNTI